MLPDWADPELLRALLLGALVVLVVLAVVVVRVVQWILLRLVLLALLAGLGAFAWAQRAELDDCARTCNCRLAGVDVSVPGCREELD